MKTNPIKEKLSRPNGIAAGAMVQTGNPDIAELIAHAGFDFVVVDGEHGSIGVDGATHLFRAIECGGAASVIRFPDDSPSAIARALDAGALGVMIPNVSTKEQAERIVSSARYRPVGSRGACPVIRATDHGLLPWEGFQEWSNENIVVWLIIETREGMENFDRIIDVPGIDAIGIGRFDLAQSLGFEGNADHPDVAAAVEMMTRKARDRNIDVISLLMETEPDGISGVLASCIGRGSRIFSFGSERQILSDRYSRLEAAVRSLVGTMS